MRSPDWSRSLSLRAASLLLGALLVTACGAVTDPNAGVVDDDASAGGPADASGDCDTACDPNADCVGAGDEATCVCRDGYEGDGERCTDVDECTAGTATCPDAATCTNVEGSFECSCPHGTVGDGAECRQNLLFLASAYFPGDPDAPPRWFLSYDVDAGVLSEEPLMPEGSDDFCNCGYTYFGPIAAQGSLYYFGNYAQRFQTDWIPVARPEHARRGEYGAAAAGGRIYFVGGRGPLDSVLFFDPVAGSWSAAGDVAPLPWATDYPAVGALDDRLFVVGKDDSAPAADVARMAVYDLAQNTWTELQPPPFASEAFQGVTVGGLFYVLPTGTQQLWTFDMKDLVWSPNSVPLPGESNYWHLTAVDGEIYLVGQDVGEPLIHVVRYAPPNQAWISVDRLGGRTFGANGYVGSSNFE